MKNVNTYFGFFKKIRIFQRIFQRIEKNADSRYTFIEGVEKIMNLNFIGRGAAFNLKEGNTNAYFIENDKLFLVDCGETMFETLVKQDILTKVKEVYVVISHTHGDHCGSLGSLGLYCQFVLHTRLKIIVPHDEAYKTSLIQLMTIFGNTDKAYECLYEEEIDGRFEAFTSVRYEQTKHDYMLMCYSLVFETPEGSVFYSADTRTVENLLSFIENHEKIQRIYMEATDLDIPGDVHLNIDILNQSLPEKVRDKVWMMHVRSDQCIDRIKALELHVVKTGNYV